MPREWVVDREGKVLDGGGVTVGGYLRGTEEEFDNRRTTAILNQQLETPTT
jgi:hypothetical protein